MMNDQKPDHDIAALVSAYGLDDHAETIQELIHENPAYLELLFPNRRFFAGEVQLNLPLS